MTPLILYDVFPTFYHFYSDMELGVLFFYLKNGSAGSCINLFSIYPDSQIDLEIHISYLSIHSDGINSYGHVLFGKSKIEIVFRRDGRVVDSSGLENRYSSEQRTIEGSNPSLSFCSVNRFFLYWFCLAFSSHKGEWLGQVGQPSQKKIEKRFERNELKRK